MNVSRCSYTVFFFYDFCQDGSVSTNFGNSFKVREIRPDEFTPAYADKQTGRHIAFRSCFANGQQQRETQLCVR